VRLGVVGLADLIRPHALDWIDLYGNKGSLGCVICRPRYDVKDEKRVMGTGNWVMRVE
jgi:hypothetical protein